MNRPLLDASLLKQPAVQIAVAAMVVFLSAVTLSARNAEPPDRLFFKVMLSAFSNGGLTQLQTARLVVSANGVVHGTFDLQSGGRLDFNIPTETEADWVLSAGELDERRFSSRIVDGFLQIKNKDRGDRSVYYYALADGSYALEYFQDSLYICNQGEPDGPILGRLKTGQRVEQASTGQVISPRRTYSTLDLEGAWHGWGGNNEIWMDFNRDGQIVGYAEADETILAFDGGATVDSEGRVNGWLYFIHEDYDGEILSLSVSFWGLFYSPSSMGGRYEDSDGNSDDWRLEYQSPDPPPPGGPEDDFGGTNNPKEVVAEVIDHVDNLSPIEEVSQEYNDAIDQGQPVKDNRAIPFSLTAYGASANGVIQPGGTPGVVFQWVYAGGTLSDQWVLPLDGEGNLPNGISWRTIIGTNSSGVPIIVVLRTLPAEFLIGLAPGTHTLNYWLQDSEGRKSNLRSEELIINDQTEQKTGPAPKRRAP